MLNRTTTLSLWSSALACLAHRCAQHQTTPTLPSPGSGGGFKSGAHRGSPLLFKRVLPSLPLTRGRTKEGVACFRIQSAAGTSKSPKVEWIDTMPPKFETQ